MTTIKELAAAAVELQNFKQIAKKAEDERKSANKKAQELEEIVIPDMLDELGLEFVSVRDVGRVGLRSEMRASIREGQKESALKWLVANGHGGLVSETVNSSSLKALAKRLFQESEEGQLPEDIFNTQPYTKATITKR